MAACELVVCLHPQKSIEASVSECQNKVSRKTVIAFIAQVTTFRLIARKLIEYVVGEGQIEDAPSRTKSMNCSARMPRSSWLQNLQAMLFFAL